MKKVNLTIELRDDEHIYHFEKFIRKNVEVKDFTILSDTKELYENDPAFKKIITDYRRVKKIRNDYINEHNFK